MMKDLNGIKVGDTVAIRGRYGIAKAVVERVSKTQVACSNGNRYLISNGTLFGGGRWNYEHIQVWDAECDAALAEFNDQRSLALAHRRLSDFTWRSLNAEQCEAVLAALITNGAKP